jgi:PAS domain S-box-containing protein
VCALTFNTSGRNYETEQAQTMQDNFMPEHQAKLELSAAGQSDELQQLYDCAPCGYHSLDRQGLYLRINQTELKMLGYEWDEVVGKIRFPELLTPESKAKFSKSFPKFQKEGSIEDLEFEMVRKDGSILPISLSASVIRDKKGNYLMSRSVVVDISDRKRSEVERQEIEFALQQSQHFIEHIIHAVPYIVSVYSLDERRTVYINRSLGEVLGYPPAEIEQMGRQIIDFLHHPDEPHPIDISLNNVSTIQDGEIREFEHRMRHFNGEWRWHHVRYTSFARHPEGRISQVLAIVHDITASKQAQLELQYTEDRLRYLLTANPAVIYACEASGRYAATFVSENVTGMFGYHSWDFLADPHFWSHQIHPEDRERVFADLQMILKRGRHVYEYRFLHQNGNYIWVRDELRLILDAQGEPLEIIGYWSDITERKQSEQTMHEQADLLDIAPDAIFVHNLDYQILYWNKGAEQLYGWQTADAIGQDSRQFVSEDALAQFEAAMAIVLSAGTWQGELTKIAASGKSVIVSSRKSLLRDAAGNPKSILIVETDITEQKQLESQFFRAQRLESLGTLASGIAHDLNNILTPILGIVEILPLQFPNLDDRTQNLLTILNDSTRRGADLVKQILSFTRGVEGKPTYIQVHHLIKEIQRIIKQAFPKNIEATFDYSKHLWTIEADSTPIHQVLMNLCVNARDAMPDGGTLSIGTENLTLDENYARIHLDAHAGDYIVISIADTGMGMTPETIDRIFDPFFTTKDIGKGTGLGLSTSMGIIKSHDGFITVYSEVGKGTCFKVYLPATDTHETESPPILDLPLGNNELILIVDDEISVRAITGTTLETYNYRVLTANDGIEAIATYAEHKKDIHVILLDLMMPALDTVTTVRTLHKLNPHVKIIAMSGLSTNEQMTKNLRDSGVRTFLAKPFTAEDLLNTLEQVCAQ